MRDPRRASRPARGRRGRQSCPQCPTACLPTSSPGYGQAMPSKRSPRGPSECRRRFLRQFPGGFSDETYLAWERDYKWRAHRRWRAEVGGKVEFRSKLADNRHHEVSNAAVRIEAGQPLLFSYEKMALKDAIRSGEGAQRFAQGCYDWLWGDGTERERFE